MTKNLVIDFGVVGEPIGVQLLNQGVRSSGQEADRWENQRNAINFLRCSGLLANGEATKLEKKVLRQMSNVLATD